MFREVSQTSQKHDEPIKRWFASLKMDLFVWINGNEEIVSYHLTYNKPHDEKALTWDKESGFSHLGVDDGARPGKYPCSPLLVADGVFNPSRIISMLSKDKGDVTPWIKDFIVSGIEGNFK